MNKPSRYWQICRLSLANNRGYEYQAIAVAKEFWQQQAEEASLSRFLTLFAQNSALAGLCLRCYVSYPIFKERELIDYLRDTLNWTLTEAIKKAVGDRVTKLNKSKKYRPFANKFVTGLRLYYCQEMSLKEIVPVLELGNWDRARRILNPGDFLNTVRTQTIQLFLKNILQKARDLGLTSISLSPDRLQTISQQIESFADTAIFQDAAAEIKAGKNRTLKSEYAEQIRNYCQQQL